jgi:hypothetical protein
VPGTRPAAPGIPLVAIAPLQGVRHAGGMLARVRSGALRGIDALVVDVEVDVAPGLPQTNTVGLPDGAVREGRRRCTEGRGGVRSTDSPRAPGGGG